MATRGENPTGPLTPPVSGDRWRCAECGHLATGNDCGKCGQSRMLGELLDAQSQVLGDGAIMLNGQSQGAPATLRLEPGSKQHAEEYQRLVGVHQADEQEILAYWTRRRRRRTLVFGALVALVIGSLVASYVFTDDSHETHSAALAKAILGSGPSKDEGMIFRQYVRRNYQPNQVPDITDAARVGFTPTLQVKINDYETPAIVETAKTVCAMINAWIIDTSDRYAEQGQVVGSRNRKIVTCRPFEPTEVALGS